MGSANLKFTEPSMEDILASIRRIISDDHEAAPEPSIARAQPSPLENVLDIAERHVSSAFHAELASLDDDTLRNSSVPPDDIHHEDYAVSLLMEGNETPQPVSHHEAFVSEIVVPVQAPVRPYEVTPGESLLSQTARVSVSDAFGRLEEALPASPPKTIEDLMKEMLRPMLKTWLDGHLPSLVERLVREEIERVSRGRA